MKRKIITLCGSTRFKDHHLAIAARETLLGHIVISVGFFHHVDKVPITSDQKGEIDDLHFDKIRMSDEIIVINPNGYIGESTSNEIACAIANNKPIRWTDEKAGEKFLQDNSHKLGKVVAERFML